LRTSADVGFARLCGSIEKLSIPVVYCEHTGDKSVASAQKENGMRKFVLVLLLAALLIGTLGGCGLFGDSDLRAYNDLLAEMASLTEYRFSGTMSLSIDPVLFGGVDFAFAGFMPMHLTVEGTASYWSGEVHAAYQMRRADGTVLFDAEMIVHGPTMYVGLVPIMDAMLRPVLLEMGADLSGFSMADDVLGGYAYLAVPHEGDLTDVIFAPPNVTGGLDVGPFLVRQGEAFIVTLTGEDVRAVAVEIGELLVQFIADGAEDEIGDVLGGMTGRLISADMTDARVQVTTSHLGEVFRQIIEMDVPGVLEMEADFSFTAEGVLPVSVPERALTEAELTELMLNLDFGAIFGWAQSGSAGGGSTLTDEITVLYDLAGMNLIGHTLGEGSLLATAALPNGRGGEHAVTIISRGTASAGDDHVFCDADAIGMQYFALTSMDAVEAVLQAVEADRVGYFLLDSRLTASTLRTNSERSLAVMAIAEQTTAGLDRMRIYLAQVVGEDVVRLELELYMNLFGGEDHVVLALLSAHMGVDLGAYVTELLR